MNKLVYETGIIVGGHSFVRREVAQSHRLLISSFSRWRPVFNRKAIRVAFFISSGTSLRLTGGTVRMRQRRLLPYHQTHQGVYGLLRPLLCTLSGSDTGTGMHKEWGECSFCCAPEYIYVSRPIILLVTVVKVSDLTRKIQCRHYKRVY